MSRLWVRLWLFAGMLIGMTVTLVIAGFLGIQLWLEHVAKHSIPPEVTAELRLLEQRGETLSLRYNELYSRYLSPYSPLNDYTLLALLAAVSIACSGAFAFVMARRIGRPISSVAAAAERFAAGELDARAKTDGAVGETAALVERFNAMAETLSQYERERQVLTAGIAHELRTPLTAMKTRLHALADGVVPLERSEAERLLGNADQLSRLVDDLRTLAFVDAGELAFELRPVDLYEIAKHVVEDHRLTAGEAGVSLLAAGSTTIANGDPLRIAQIVANLLTNAVKHAPAGSLVTVTTCEDGGRSWITVEDEGSGFDERDREKMFVAFWRASSDRDAGYAGSGLGLALAAALAEAQGGEVRATNRASGGARFELELPGLSSAAVSSAVTNVRR